MLADAAVHISRWQTHTDLRLCMRWTMRNEPGELIWTLILHSMHHAKYLHLEGLRSCLTHQNGLTKTICCLVFTCYWNIKSSALVKKLWHNSAIPSKCREPGQDPDEKTRLRHDNYMKTCSLSHLSVIFVSVIYYTEKHSERNKQFSQIMSKLYKQLQRNTQCYFTINYFN